MDIIIIEYCTMLQIYCTRRFIAEELILAIGDFSEISPILKSPILNYMDTPTKPLQKLEKKDMVAQIANIKSTNCFLQTNSHNITLANKYSCTVPYQYVSKKL